MSSSQRNGLSPWAGPVQGSKALPSAKPTANISAKAESGELQRPPNAASWRTSPVWLLTGGAASSKAFSQEAKGLARGPAPAQGPSAL